MCKQVKEVSYFLTKIHKHVQNNIHCWSRKQLETIQYTLMTKQEQEQLRVLLYLLRIVSHTLRINGKFKEKIFQTDRPKCRQYLQSLNIVQGHLLVQNPKAQVLKLIQLLHKVIFRWHIKHSKFGSVWVPIGRGVAVKFEKPELDPKNPYASRILSSTTCPQISTQALWHIYTVNIKHKHK